jgi:phosphohistidine phosphatase
MKTLYLIRHAKSSWDSPTQTDFERTLDERGLADAPMMGGILHQQHIKPNLIVSSSAKRAITTAKLIAEKIGYPGAKIVATEKIYEASLTTLLETVQHLPNDANSVMLFGHNPGFTKLANYLTTENIQDFPTCGVFCIELKIESWHDAEKAGGTCKFFDYPKRHKT